MPSRTASCARRERPALRAALWGLENTGQAINGATGTAGADIEAPRGMGAVDGRPARSSPSSTAASTPATRTFRARCGRTRGGGRQGHDGVDDDLDGAIDDFHGWNALDTITDVTDAVRPRHARDRHARGAQGQRPRHRRRRARRAGVPDPRPRRARQRDRRLRRRRPSTWPEASASRSSTRASRRPPRRRSRTRSTAHPEHALRPRRRQRRARRRPPATSSLCQLPAANLVCVGASDANDASRSSRPAVARTSALTTVDLFAPGRQHRLGRHRLVCAGRPSVPASACYAFLDGTSMAAPHVSGALALMRARNPALTAAELKAKLLASVDPKAAPSPARPSPADGSTPPTAVAALPRPPPRRRPLAAAATTAAHQRAGVEHGGGRRRRRRGAAVVAAGRRSRPSSGGRRSAPAR